MKKVIRLTESDLVRLVNKVISEQEMDENFKEGPMRKPEGFFSKMMKGAKDAMGIENSKDRKSLESIYRTLEMDPSYEMVTNVREIKPRVMLASLNGRSLVVDSETPEILWGGNPLELKDIQGETRALFRKLIPFATETKRFGSESPMYEQSSKDISCLLNSGYKKDTIGGPMTRREVYTMKKDGLTHQISVSGGVRVFNNNTHKEGKWSCENGKVKISGLKDTRMMPM